MDLHNSKIVFQKLYCLDMLFAALQFSYLYIFVLSVAWNVTHYILHVKHFTTLTFFAIREGLLIKTREGIIEMF